jgi:type IV secretory pathway VirB3-like protein
MTFVTDYLLTIDYIALAALVVLAAVAFIRNEGFWIGLVGLVILLWAASRFMHLF